MPYLIPSSCPTYRRPELTLSVRRVWSIIPTWYVNIVWYYTVIDSWIKFVFTLINLIAELLVVLKPKIFSWLSTVCVFERIIHWTVREPELLFNGLVVIQQRKCSDVSALSTLILWYTSLEEILNIYLFIVLIYKNVSVVERFSHILFSKPICNPYPVRVNKQLDYTFNTPKPLYWWV